MIKKIPFVTVMAVITNPIGVNQELQPSVLAKKMQRASEDIDYLDDETDCGLYLFMPSQLEEAVKIPSSIADQRRFSIFEGLKTTSDLTRKTAAEIINKKAQVVIVGGARMERECYSLLVNLMRLKLVASWYVHKEQAQFGDLEEIENAPGLTDAEGTGWGQPWELDELQVLADMQIIAEIPWMLWTQDTKDEANPEADLWREAFIAYKSAGFPDQFDVNNFPKTGKEMVSRLELLDIPIIENRQQLDELIKKFKL